jgi:hypothetical protein
MYINSVGLFAPTLCITLYDVLTNEEVKDFITSHIDLFKNSKNIFIFLEKKALKDTVTLFKKNSEDCISFEEKKMLSVPEVSPFILTDAFGARDKKNSWVILQKLLMLEKSAEEISGLLFWQVKSILLVKMSPTSTPANLGMNPFAHKKILFNSKKFSIEELKSILKNLSLLLARSRKSGVDSTLSLEQFLLKSL